MAFWSCDCQPPDDWPVDETWDCGCVCPDPWNWERWHVYPRTQIDALQDSIGAELAESLYGARLSPDSPPTMSGLMAWLEAKGP